MHYIPINYSVDQSFGLPTVFLDQFTHDQFIAIQHINGELKEYWTCHQKKKKVSLMKKKKSFTRRRGRGEIKAIAHQWIMDLPSKQQKKKNYQQERQWRSAHPASRNIKYRKFHVVQFSTGQKRKIWCPWKGLKIKQERQWRSAHPASRNIKYRKFHVVQFSTGQKINISCPGKGLKIRKLEWEKYKFDAPEGTWKKKKKKKKKKADCTPGSLPGLRKFA